MELIYDEELIKQSKYNKRNLAICRCGRCRELYPSKKMFIEFLKQFSDIEGEARISSIDFPDKTKISVELMFQWKEGV